MEDWAYADISDDDALLHTIDPSLADLGQLIRDNDRIFRYARETKTMSAGTYDPNSLDLDNPRTYVSTRDIHRLVRRLLPRGSVLELIGLEPL